MLKTIQLIILTCLAFFSRAQQNTIDFCAIPKISHQKIDFTFCSVPESKEYAYGICWSQSPEPTLFSSFNIFTSTPERYVYSVKQLQANTDYYFRIFQLFQNGSVNYYPEFKETTLPEVHIGDYYQGGIVVYLCKPQDSLYMEGEQHGLIMSKSDLGFANWGIKGQATSARTSYKLGHGMKNTKAIVDDYRKNNLILKQNSPANSGSLRIVNPCAALLCSTYENDGYNDWFLPSNQEWQAIFSKIDSLAILGLNNYEYYWTSHEVYISWSIKKTKRRETKSQYRSAWAIKIHSLSLMSSAMTRKNSVARVRAMRYF